MGAAIEAQWSVPVVLKGLGLCKQAALSPLQKGRSHLKVRHEPLTSTPDTSSMFAELFDAL